MLVGGSDHVVSAGWFSRFSHALTSHETVTVGTNLEDGGFALNLLRWSLCFRRQRLHLGDNSLDYALATPVDLTDAFCGQVGRR
jgi:hypothetical protein